MRLLILLVCLALVRAVHIDTAIRTGRPVPLHIPTQTVNSNLTFEIPYWLGAYYATVEIPSTTWTLPLTIGNGGLVYPGEFLIIRNYGPENITLYPTAPESIEGAFSYLIQANTVVEILSGYPDWVVVTPFGIGNVTCGAGLICSGIQVSLEPVGTSGPINYPTSLTTNAYGQIVSTTTGSQPLTALTKGVGTYVSGSGNSRTVNTYVASAKDYGAIGDGITDDSQAIKAAFNATAAAGGELYIPAGVYFLNSGLVALQNCVNGFTVRGAGSGVTILRKGSVSGTIIDLRNCSNVTITDLAIECRHSIVGGSVHGFSSTGGHDITVERVSVSDSIAASFVATGYTGTRTERAVFRQCIARLAPFGFIISSAIGSSILDSFAYTIKERGPDPGTTAYAFEIKSPCTGCTIQNCYAEDSTVASAFGWQNDGITETSSVVNIRCTNCYKAFVGSYMRNNLVSNIVVSLTGSGCAIQLGNNSTRNSFEDITIKNLGAGGTASAFCAAGANVAYNTAHFNEIDYANTVRSQSLGSFTAGTNHNTVLYDSLTDTGAIVTSPYPYVLNNGDATNIVSIANLHNRQSLVIASDAVALANGFVDSIQVDTEGSTASDNLATINNGMDGQTITITQNDAARNVVVLSGVGNIVLANGVDMDLAGITSTLTLIYTSRASKWLEVSRSANSLPVESPL